MSKAEKFISDCTRNCSNEMESPLYANPKLKRRENVLGTKSFTVFS